jgi:cation transport regulator ChaC
MDLLFASRCVLKELSRIVSCHTLKKGNPSSKVNVWIDTRDREQFASTENTLCSKSVMAFRYPGSRQNSDQLFVLPQGLVTCEIAGLKHCGNTALGVLF